ncbi:hypothetical protein [Paenibacillus sp. UNC451MF]|uniref:hypothetical protein n=1 Tax=Paenibacillus sp. UNC451MF TaxID=1449063 RepID=UPI000A744A0D|nr:hypothetical protein [Paenibacillus sp. UNC451MF]
MQFPQEKVIEALQHSLSRVSPLQTQIVEIGLVDITFDSVKSLRSRTIASVMLEK